MGIDTPLEHGSSVASAKWPARQRTAFTLLTSGYPAAAVARAPSVNVAPSTMHKWITGWLEEGRIEEDHDAVKLHPRLKIYRVNKGMIPGGEQGYCTDPAQTPADGSVYRPHAEQYVGTLLDLPGLTPSRVWGRRIYKRWRTPGTEHCMVDLGDGWKAQYSASRKRATLVIHEPNTVWVPADKLEEEGLARDNRAYRIFAEVCRKLGSGAGTLLRKSNGREVGTPIADPSIARLAGVRVETPDGKLWVDRSDHGTVPGAVELEGDEQAMAGLAHMPKRMDSGFGKVETLLGKLVKAVEEAAEEPPVPPDDGRDVA